MAFYVQGGPSRGQLQSKLLGESLGESLGQFTSDYLVSKEINKVIDNPAYKDMSLGEKQQLLTKKLAPYGKSGENLLARQLQLEPQMAGEQILNKIRGKIDPNTGMYKGSQTELALDVAQAMSYNPNMQRSIGPLLETLTTLGNSGQLAQNLSGEMPQSGQGGVQQPGQQNQEIAPMGNSIGAQNVPSVQAQNQIRQQAQVQQGGSLIAPIPGVNRDTQLKAERIGQEFINENFPQLNPNDPGFGKKSFFNQSTQTGLSVDQEGALRKKWTASGVPAKAQDIMVNKINGDIARQFTEASNIYNLNKEQVQANEVKWKQLMGDDGKSGLRENYLKKYTDYFANPKATEAFNNKYAEYAAMEDPNQTPQQIDYKVQQKLTTDIRNFEALKDATSFGAFSRGNEEEIIGLVKGAVAPLKNKGYDEAILDDLAEKGFGEEQKHFTLYGDQTSKNSLKAVENISPGFKYHRWGQHPEPMLNERELENIRKKSGPYEEKLSKALLDIKPEDDLILLRAAALNNGASEENFLKALDKARGEGLELSPFQQKQLGALSVTRTPPLQEIWNPNNWSKFYNYMRGKR